MVSGGNAWQGTKLLPAGGASMGRGGVMELVSKGSGGPKAAALVDSTAASTAIVGRNWYLLRDLIEPGPKAFFR